jgi:ADP-ribose pyrophosphatase YjhB (NUDIX family)
MISERDTEKGKVLISAYAIIKGLEGAILFIHEGDTPYHNFLVLPGGYVKPSETVEQTVVREVEEETGLKVASTRLVGLYEDFLTQENEPINHLIGAYEAEVVGGRIIFTKEAVAYKWLTAEEAQNSMQVPKVFKEIAKDIGKEHKKRFSLWKKP